MQRAIDRVRAGGPRRTERDGAVWLRSSALGDDKDRVLVRSDGTLHVRRRRPGLHRGQARARVRHGRVRARRRPPRLRRPAQGRGAGARLRPRPDRRPDLPARAPAGRARCRSGPGASSTLDDLLDAIGVDAARYALVQRGHDQPIDLDIELLTAQNAENPVYYCQYAHARIAAILRKAGGGRWRVPDPAWTPEPAETRAGQGARRVPRPGRRGRRAARPAPHRRLRPGDREGLPPVLQAVPRDRRRAGRRAQPARAVPGDGAGDGDGARPGRRGGSRLDVTRRALLP